MDDKRRLFLSFSGLLFSTLPTAICVLSYFPVWKEKGAPYLLSGFTLCLLLLALLPAVRLIKNVLRSPSAPLIWFFSFILFFALSRIAHEMTVISFVGFISNLIGAYLFKKARNGERDNEKQS